MKRRNVVVIVIKLAKIFVEGKLDLFAHHSLADEASAIWERF